jgi:hypothetical protein
MDFLLKVTGGDHDCVPIAAIVTIGKDYAESLLCLIEEAGQMKKVYPEFYGITLWDGSADWIGDKGGVNLVTADLLEDLDFNEIAIQEDIDTEGVKMANVECGTIFVQPDEVYWEGIVKHTGIHLETSAILLKDIEKIAGRKACVKRK